MQHSSTYTYDNLSRLIVASTTMASSSPYKHTFTYSSIGNMTGMATTGATTTYTYSETGSTNPSAPTAIGSGSLTYDTNGNLTAYNATKYSWDYRNRMVSTGNGVATTTFAYDHTYERVKKVGNTTTYYPNDLYSVEGATTTRYIYANSALIATVESNGTATSTRYYHPDHLGGTNVVTSELANVLQTLDYYPYGDIRIKSGSYSASRTFIKELQDLETDLNYLNARYYDNNRGQFLSQDPVFWEVGETNDGKLALMNPQVLNSYSYAGNNPIINKDTEGRSVQTFVEGAAKGVITAATIATIIALAPVAIPASIATAIAVGGTAVVGYGTYENYQAYRKGEITKDEFDFNAGFLLGGTGFPRFTQGLSQSTKGSIALKSSGLSRSAFANKLNHVFGNPEHNLDGLVKRFGSQEKAFSAIEKATLRAVSKEGITGTFKDLEVKVGSYTVTVRGRVANDTLDITTAYIKK